MANLEERLTAIKHDNAELRQKIELQTIAIGALVNKATLERVNEKNDKIFDALIAHDRFTNQQLAEPRGGQTDLDGKIVGMQTETRQGFKDTQTQMIDLDGKIVGVQTEMRQRFDLQQTETRQRFDLQDAHSEAQDQKFDQIMRLLNTLINKSNQDI